MSKIWLEEEMAEKQIAIYARVSSDQQVDEGTIDSQIAALRDRVEKDGQSLAEELVFIDEGYSGANLIRPGLEQLRDVAALNGLDRLYVHSPDRLARRYAYQVLLMDEFQQAGIEVVFLNRELSGSPEDDLLLQVQGMIAEYERAKILERSRRGKRHAARSGDVAVLSGAPYGYHYVTKQEGGGQASYEVIPDEAKVVQQVFQWVGRERCSTREVCRRLHKAGIRTRTGKRSWDRTMVWGMLKNPAYKGTAAYGKTKQGPMKPRLHTQRNSQEHPKRPKSVTDLPPEKWLLIPVPPLVDEALFEAVQTQLLENRQRARQRKRGARYLLQGLLVCAQCRYAYYGKPVSNSSAKGKKRDYAYYRCIGTDAYRFGGERVCDNLQVRTDKLDQYVWQEVCALLQEPERLSHEYQRRLHTPDGEQRSLQVLQTQISRRRKSIARLIDSYTEGYIEKREFEPRIQRLRQHLTDLEDQVNQKVREQTQQAELRQVITHLEEFSAKVKDGLDEADWLTKRELIRTLVKQVNVGKEDVTIVFRVTPDPFVADPDRSFSSSNQGSLQHCWGRNLTDPSEYDLGWPGRFLERETSENPTRPTSETESGAVRR
jgi:site-specific DNA recombinase